MGESEVEDMTILDKKEKSKKYRYRKTVIAYACTAAGTFIFNYVYTIFGHGVRSNYMTYMFLYPLISGVFYLFLWLVFPKLNLFTGYRLFYNLFNSGIALLTTGSMLKGIMEIAGTSSVYLKFYFAVGYLFLGAGFIVMMILAFHYSTEATKYNKVIALTFDDGPDAKLTPLVLDKLDKYNVPATFMMVGQLLNDSTCVVIKRIIDSGCEIGNHSWSYNNMNSMSEAEIKKSINDTNSAILKYSGTTPKFFRAPYLSTSEAMFKAIDLTFIQGVTSRDWDKSTTAEQRADLLIKGAKDGAILNMHDVQPLPHPTPEALDIVIPALQKEGYRFVTLSELFKMKGVTLDPNDDKMYTYVS